jgi:Amidases related to nicotinamidase
LCAFFKFKKVAIVVKIFTFEKKIYTMKKQSVIVNSLIMILLVFMTACGGRSNANQDTATNDSIQQVDQPTKMLIIVDPQIDFISGSLAVAHADSAMDVLVSALSNGKADEYSNIVVTKDFHPVNHCSFTEQGGVFPPHCVQNTQGCELYASLQNVLSGLGDKVVYLTKGDNQDKEEFSIFQNEANADSLKTMIADKAFDGIDICGIASDYCVFETLKDLLAFYPADKVCVADNCIAAVADDEKLVKFMSENSVSAIKF